MVARLHDAAIHKQRATLARNPAIIVLGSVSRGISSLGGTMRLSMGEEVRVRDHLPFSGIIPANLLPFMPDYSIDAVNYRRHLRWLADVPGVTALTVNGHAAEVSSLQRDERRRALALGLDEVGSRLPLITGIYTDNTLEAIALARDAKAEGASGLLVFPPTLFMWGAQLRPEMPYRHFAMIAEAVDIPLGIIKNLNLFCPSIHILFG